MRAGGDGLHGISPALKLRLQRFPSYRWRHPSSCIRHLSIPPRGLSSAVTVPFTHIALFMRRSVYYPLAYCVAPLVASLHYSACRLRLLHHPDEPPSTLGCVCMGGDSRCFSRGHCCVHPGGELSFALGHAAFSPCPYSVTGLSIGYIGDSYLLSGLMVLSRPTV